MAPFALLGHQPRVEYIERLVAMATASKVTTRLVASLFALIALALVVAATATADVQTTPFEPNDHASCLGLFSVVLHVEPFLVGTRQEVAQIIQTTAQSEGISPGQLTSSVAREHRGVYAFCDLQWFGLNF